MKRTLSLAYGALRHRAARERGQSLMEALITILIIGIMAISTMMLVSAVFNADIQSGEYLQQTSAVEQTVGLFAQRLSSANLPLGVVNGSALNPLTLAGDQVMFTAPDTYDTNQTCVRIFYQSSIQELRAQTTPGLANTSGGYNPPCVTGILPVRGPNQTPQPDQTTNCPQGETQCAWPGDADYDPAIDNLPGKNCVSSYPPAEQSNCTATTGVSLPVSATAQAALGGYVLAAQVHQTGKSANTTGISYFDGSHNLLNSLTTPSSSSDPTPDPEACGSWSGSSCPGVDGSYSGSANTWYTSAGAPWDNIYTVGLGANIASGGTGQVSLPTFWFYQEFSLQSACPAVGQTVPTVPGTVIVDGQALGAGSAYLNVGASNAGAIVQSNTTGPTYLAQPTQQADIASEGGQTLNTWLQFSGHLTVYGPASDTGTLRVILEKNGATGTPGQSDANSRSEVDFPFLLPAGTSAAAPLAIPYTGQFKLPAVGAANTDSYTVQVELASGAGAGGIFYSDSPAQEELQWTAVVRQSQ